MKRRGAVGVTARSGAGASNSGAQSTARGAGSAAWSKELGMAGPGTEKTGNMAMCCPPLSF
eukprot:11576202-Prorocentrum_lima.AAC.1